MCLCYCNPSADLAKVRGRQAPPPFSPLGTQWPPPFAPAGSYKPPSLPPRGAGICPHPSSPVVDFYPSSTVISQQFCSREIISSYLFMISNGEGPRACRFHFSLCVCFFQGLTDWNVSVKVSSHKHLLHQRERKRER